MSAALDEIQPLGVSPAEAARILGVKRTKLYELIAEKQFPSFKIGSRRVIPYKELMEWFYRTLEAGGVE